MSSRVLSDREVTEYYCCHENGGEPPSIEGFTDKIERRYFFLPSIEFISGGIDRSQFIKKHSYKYRLCTTDSELKLLSFTLLSDTPGDQNITVKITSKHKDPPDTLKIISYNRFVERNTYFEMPLRYNGCYIKLLPDTVYTVKFSIPGPHCLHHTIDRVWYLRRLTITNLFYNEFLRCMSGVKYINCHTSKMQWSQL